jgi:thioredoxin reductase
LTLGRSRRRVLVVDDGNPCNRQQPRSYNLLTHDGRLPSEIAKQALQDVERYDTVEFHAGLVTNVDTTTTTTTITGNNDDGELLFRIRSTTAGEDESSSRFFVARKLILATGVQDNLLLLPPTNDVPGLQECWGKSVIHCPYCHGYEFRDRPTAMWMNSKNLMKMVPLVRTLTSNLACILLEAAAEEGSDDDDNSDNNNNAILGESHDFLLERLAKHGIPIIEETTVVEIKHDDRGQVEGVLLGNGEMLDLDVIYIRPPLEQQLPRLETDCVLEMDDEGYIRVDDNQKTSVDGIMACGDCTTPNRSLSIAIASGTRAAKMLNYELSMEEWQAD